MGTSPSVPFKDEGVDKVKNVKRGEDIILSWEANTGVYSKWRKGNRLLEKGDKYAITQSNDWLLCKLTIKDAREADEGTYTLELKNRKATVSGSIEVKLLEYDVDWRTIDWENIKKENDRLKSSLAKFKPSKSEVSHLRFLLHGPAAAGKSSIINSISSVFQGRVQVKASAAPPVGTSHTTIYKSYKIKDKDGTELPFIFNDIMGTENVTGGGVQTADVISALKGHVKEGYEFRKKEPLSDDHSDYNKHPTMNDKAHCLVSVIGAHSIPLMNVTDGAIVKMKKVRDVANGLGIPQIVFMTHVDECCPLVNKDLKHIYSSKKIKQAIQHCSNKLGVPLNCIFPVKNYFDGHKLVEKMDGLILDALQNIVNYADDYLGDT